MGVEPGGIRRACDISGSLELVCNRGFGDSSAAEMSRRLLGASWRPEGSPFFGARESYAARFFAEFGARGRVVDLGAMAALSRLEATGPLYDRGALDAAAPHLEATAATPLDAQVRSARPADGRGPAGRFADALRQAACDQMADPESGAAYFPWFACATGAGGGVTYTDYKTWFARARSREFAAAGHALPLVRILRLRIAMAPPHLADVVSGFDPLRVGDIRRILLGNNDAHCVALVYAV